MKALVEIVEKVWRKCALLYNLYYTKFCIKHLQHEYTEFSLTPPPPSIIFHLKFCFKYFVSELESKYGKNPV